MPTGLVVLLVAIVAAAAFGVYRKRTDGRLNVVAASAPTPAEATPAAPEHGLHLRHHVKPESLRADQIGVELGEQATLVQFSSAFCQPCRATRQVLEQISDMVPGVTHVEIDAESHLDLVRALDIRRTPTVFVLRSDGTIARRAAGVPRKADVIAAIGELV
jgi:thiol-disulfide isomerase/thioredoxin